MSNKDPITLIGADYAHSENEYDLDEQEHNKEIVNIALRYLCLREYSENELKKKILLKNNFSESELEVAIKYLKVKNYLNESRYIRQKSNILKLKGFSTSYIIRHLHTEGVRVEKDQIEELELTGDEENIKKLILKKTSRLKTGQIDHKKYQSIIRYALSKGHEYQAVKSVLNSILSEL